MHHQFVVQLVYMSHIFSVRQYTPVQTLSGHDGSINALAASYLRGGMQEKGRATLPALVATASADSTVKIWAREEHGGENYTFSGLDEIYMVYPSVCDV